MLHRALNETSTHITELLTKEIMDIGKHTDQLEGCMGAVETNIATQQQSFDRLQDDSQSLSSKLEDFENHSHYSNLRFRGFAEHMVDLQSTVTTFLQEMVPTIPLKRLEMEPIHCALVRKHPDGKARDVIAKFLFYRTKEAIIQASRDQQKLLLQGQEIQIFADLSPTTIQKCCDLKSILVIWKHQIRYRWGLPFHLSFKAHGHWHHSFTLPTLQSILKNLHLLDADS